jgi:hypothetical protein
LIARLRAAELNRTPPVIVDALSTRTVGPGQTNDRIPQTAHDQGYTIQLVGKRNETCNAATPSHENLDFQ